MAVFTFFQKILRILHRSSNGWRFGNRFPFYFVHPIGRRGKKYQTFHRRGRGFHPPPTLKPSSLLWKVTYCRVSTKLKFWKERLSKALWGHDACIYEARATKKNCRSTKKYCCLTKKCGHSTKIFVSLQKKICGSTNFFFVAWWISYFFIL